MKIEITNKQAELIINTLSKEYGIDALNPSKDSGKIISQIIQRQLREKELENENK